MRLKPYLALLPILALGACSSGDYRLSHPMSLMATQEWHATILDAVVMLCIIIPVFLAMIVFGWRYHKSRNATYTPDWSHSTTLEFVVWGIPLAVVIGLSYYTVTTVYALNPYNPGLLHKQIAANPEKVLHVDVIATDWQWVFIYPDQHIATINELEVPQNTVVELRMTATSVSNDIYIPQLLPMMTLMPGMRTKDSFDAPKPGDYIGFAADFSGAGFSWMQFATHIVTPDAFAAWVQKVAASPDHLTFAAFQKVAQPQVNYGAKVSYFSNVDPMLFNQELMAVMDGKVYPVSAELMQSIGANGK